jgi:hypothetical protein
MMNPELLVERREAIMVDQDERFPADPILVAGERRHSGTAVAWEAGRNGAAAQASRS